MILALAKWGINRSFHVSIEFSFPDGFLTRRGAGLGECGNSSVTHILYAHSTTRAREVECMAYFGWPAKYQNLESGGAPIDWREKWIPEVLKKNIIEPRGQKLIQNLGKHLFTKTEPQLLSITIFKTLENLKDITQNR